MIPLAVLKPGGDAATALYIVSFSLFIIGLKQGTHPSTARRGNKIAAVGMAVAVVTTLLLDGMGNWGYIAINNEPPAQFLFIIILIAAAILGNLVVLPIGGADMPVVISMLNAFTGLSAAAAGFALQNVALIVAGTLVGSSGTILTMEMATGMNRSGAKLS